MQLDKLFLAMLYSQMTDRFILTLKSVMVWNVTILRKASHTTPEIQRHENKDLGLEVVFWATATFAGSHKALQITEQSSTSGFLVGQPPEDMLLHAHNGLFSI